MAHRRRRFAGHHAYGFRSLPIQASKTIPTSPSGRHKRFM
jgi:hypothetical protein